MTEKIFEDLRNGKDVRASLINLRQMIRNDRSGRIISEIDGDKTDILVDLLSDQDAKTRRNAALILGELGDDSLLGVLMYSYKHEQKLFIRGDYLTAIGMLDYSSVLPELEERLKEIEAAPRTDDNRKHLAQEEKKLRALISKEKPLRKHTFTGWHNMSDIILITSPGFEETARSDMPEEMRRVTRKGNGALALRTNEIKKVFSLRTVKNVLFVFHPGPVQHKDPDGLADDILQAGALRYIARRHSEGGVFYFRLDVRTALHDDEKSRFISRLSTAIEEKSGNLLINNPSDYEVTFRIMQGRSGKYSVYIEMDTVPDTRFSYRRHAIATSMNPVRAAEMVAAAAEYLADDAAVLDPMCGTGTLLIERDRRKRAGYLYGVDIYGEAVAMARENAAAADREIFFINRDFHDFTHKYLFDEIITELPSPSAKLSLDNARKLYGDFIRCIPSWLKKDRYVIICTSQPGLFTELLRNSRRFEIMRSLKLSGKRGDTVLILLYRT